MPLRQLAICGIATLILGKAILAFHTSRSSLTNNEAGARLAAVSVSGASIVACCKLDTYERIEIFERAVLSWYKLAGIQQIVVVDWQSTVSVHVLIEKVIARPRTLDVTVLQLLNTSFVRWRIAPAFNLGMRSVRGAYILKLDCDTVVHPSFLTLNPIEGIGFRYADHRNVRKDRNDLHLNGVFLARVSDLKAVHGYDERLSLYGWDDSDLYVRLNRHFMRARQNQNKTANFYQDFVRERNGEKLIAHIPHSRTHGFISERNGICFNKEALKILKPWSGVGKSKFSCRKDGNTQDVTTCVAKEISLNVQKLLGASDCISVLRRCVAGKNDIVEQSTCFGSNS